MTVRSSSPICEAVALNLFNFIDFKLTRCDHSLRFTREFIRIRHLDEEKIIQWLQALGGYCDCEVLTNVACVWCDDILDDEDDPDPHHVDSVLENLAKAGMVNTMADTFAQHVKQHADILKIIGEYVRLKKTEAQIYTAICPFCPERNPCFAVHAGRRFYYCFGCHETGDVFSFVQKIENVGFPESVMSVAVKCGIPTEC